MTERARRIQRLRRRVAVGAVATFTAAFGTVAATGSMGTATTSSAATSTTTAEDPVAIDTTTTTTADAPAAVTTRQS